MSFLDRLLGRKKISEQMDIAIEKPQSKAYDTTPDKPQPFGYKTSWLCIKSDSPEEVIEALDLKNAAPANWQSGMSQSDKIFVSPAVKGYVLVVRYDTFQGADADGEINALGNIAKSFTEMQCFATHRVVDFHTWAKFTGGALVRAYGWLGASGEVYLNDGALTLEEEELGFDNFIQSDEDDWDEVDFPDEESIIDIAAAWGVDPMFSDDEYECGVGYVCDRR